MDAVNLLRQREADLLARLREVRRLLREYGELPTAGARPESVNVPPRLPRRGRPPNADRVKVARLLAERGPMLAADICRELGIADSSRQSATSRNPLVERTVPDSTLSSWRVSVEGRRVLATMPEEPPRALPDPAPPGGG